MLFPLGTRGRKTKLDIYFDFKLIKEIQKVHTIFDKQLVKNVVEAQIQLESSSIKWDLKVYKRILKSNRAKNKLTLVSDNPVYQPYNINTEDVLEIWQSQMIISKANQQQRWDVDQLASIVNTLQDQVSTLKKRMN